MLCEIHPLVLQRGKFARPGKSLLLELLAVLGPVGPARSSGRPARRSGAAMANLVRE